MCGCDRRIDLKTSPAKIRFDADKYNRERGRHGKSLQSVRLSRKKKNSGIMTFFRSMLWMNLRSDPIRRLSISFEF